jgi:dihydroneopterin aldolase
VSPTLSASNPAGEPGRPDEVVAGQDVLRLEGMRFFGHHGCLDDERSAGVHLDVDVEVRTDTHEAARTDRVEDTIDYARLVEKCRRVVEDDSYHLVETVAERLAEGLLEEPKVASVRVRVAKRPPLAVAVDRFSVTVERRRP